MDGPAFLSALSPPACSRLLGWNLISADPEKHEIEIGFSGKREFLNPAGNIQGGILTAMMDDAMGPAVLLASNGRKIASSIDINVHFLRPVKPGSITVKARVIRFGRSIAFAEAELFDEGGKLSARATSSAQVTDLPVQAEG